MSAREKKVEGPPPSSESFQERVWWIVTAMRHTKENPEEPFYDETVERALGAYGLSPGAAQEREQITRNGLIP